MAKQKIKEKKIPRFISANDFPKYVTRKEYIEIGKVFKTYNYITEAGIKQNLAKKYFPIMIYVNQFILSLSFITIIILFYSLGQNESPTLIANFNTGKLMCSNPAIDINNDGKSIGRESGKYQKICDQLEDFSTKEGE